jgi:predicted component of viral defense system (DUF524 family)
MNTAKTITFKTKPYIVWDGDIKRTAITFKKEINKTDTNIKPHEHRYYNANMFKGMLNKTYKQIIGEYKTWAFIDAMPANVSIDTSKFLAVVTVSLPASFN